MGMRVAACVRCQVTGDAEIGAIASYETGGATDNDPPPNGADQVKSPTHTAYQPLPLACNGQHILVCKPAEAPPPQGVHVSLGEFGDLNRPTRRTFLVY